MDVSMDDLTCGLINGPFVVFNIIANAFFIFCMVCPPHRERIKQPLKFLLGSLICCTVTYLMSGSVMFFYRGSGFMAQYVVYIWSLSKTKSSCVWLNFFYYTHIVPAQRTLFIWIKRNIKPIIYCIWLLEMIYSLFDVGIMLMFYHSPGDTVFDAVSYNSTVAVYTWSALQLKLLTISLSVRRFHLFISLCVMVMSSSSTVIYLSRHMRRMVANGQSTSCPRFRGQVRVTVTGILQGVLYVFCMTWDMYRFLSKPTFLTFNRNFSDFTVFNLYMSGTTFSLGAGQGVFRQRAADIWLRAAQCCKARKVQQSEQGG